MSREHGAEKPQSLSSEELSKIMKEDVQGSDTAFDWLVDDLVNVYLAEHPEDPNKEKLLRITTSTAAVTADDKNFILDFFTSTLKINQQVLEYRLMKVYASQNNINILTQ